LARNKRILVTGAAGFIGSHLCERLAGVGHDVLGVDCRTDHYSTELKDLNTECLRDSGVHLDSRDLAVDEVGTLMGEVEYVFHLAAQPGISSSTPFDAYLRNNIVATHRLMEAAIATTTLQGFLHISTSSVYGADATGDESTEPRPTSYYGVTKLAAEQLVLAAHRERNIPSCSLRLFSVYGPRERPEKLYPRLVGSILEGRPFPLFEGSEKHVRSYTYVGDIVDGLVAALDNFDSCAGEVFNIGTDVAHTTGEGIEIVQAITGQSARFERKPRRAGDQTRTQADITKARQVLGYDPTTSLGEGLKAVVEWYQSQILGRIDLWPSR
jgi:UDP-glucuronate 4-epimerase